MGYAIWKPLPNLFEIEADNYQINNKLTYIKQNINMKKQIIRSLTGLLVIFLLSFSPILLAQDPPPPPSVGHGQSGNQPPGGGAPIGSGLVFLLALGAAYGGKKVYDMRKEER